MTKVLEQAIEKAKILSDKEQDEIATLILEEIKDENAWDNSFSKSQDLLANLASEAMAEDYAKKTMPLIIKKL